MALPPLPPFLQGRWINEQLQGATKGFVCIKGFATLSCGQQSQPPAPNATQFTMALSNRDQWFRGGGLRNKLGAVDGYGSSALEACKNGTKKGLKAWLSDENCLTTAMTYSSRGPK